MDLRVTVVQPVLAWEDPAANRENIGRLMAEAEPAALIVLPEMFNTGFSMASRQLAEKMDGPTVQWMQEQARKQQAAVTGSLIISEEGRYYNRMVWTTPDGEVQWYDKRHLFTMGREHLHFSPGHRRVTVEWKGWRIRLLVCYDLRFPVWSRNHDDYDLLIIAANWPSARHQVWKTLPVARALENQCYGIAVNRVGSDGMGLTYLGDSMMVTPKGEVTLMGDQVSVHTFTLSLQKLHEFRKKFPVLNDRDPFGMVEDEQVRISE